MLPGTPDRARTCSCPVRSGVVFPLAYRSICTFIRTGLFCVEHPVRVELTENSFAD